MGKPKRSKQSGKTVASAGKRSIQVTKALGRVLFTSKEREQNQHRHFSITHFQDGRILLEPVTQNRYRLRGHTQSQVVGSSPSGSYYSAKQHTDTLCQSSSQDSLDNPGAYGAHISNDALFFYDVRRRHRNTHSDGVDDGVQAPDNKPPQGIGGQPSAPEKDLAHLPRRVTFSDSDLPDDKQQPTVGGQPSALQYLADLPQCFQMVKTEALSGGHLVVAQEDPVVGGLENTGFSSTNEFSTGESRYPTNCVVGEKIHYNYIPPNDCESKSSCISEVASCYAEPWYSPWQTRVPMEPCHNLWNTSLPQPHQDNVGPCLNRSAWGLRGGDEKGQGDLCYCVSDPVSAVNSDTSGDADGMESGQHWPSSAGSKHEPSRHPAHLRSLGRSIMQQNNRIEWLSTILS